MMVLHTQHHLLRLYSSASSARYIKAKSFIHTSGSNKDLLVFGTLNCALSLKREQDGGVAIDVLAIRSS